MSSGNAAGNAAGQSSSRSGNPSSQGGNSQSGNSTKQNSGLHAAADEAAGQVQHMASGLGDQVRQQATAQVTNQKERAASGLEMGVQLLRQASEQVREQDQAPIAGSIDGVANRVEQWSETLKSQDVSQLLDEARQVARAQPALFVGGALALGFLGVRFLKSSPQEDSAKTPQSRAGGSPSGSNQPSPSMPNTSRTGQAGGSANTPPQKKAEHKDTSMPANQNTASSEAR